VAGTGRDSAVKVFPFISSASKAAKLEGEVVVTIALYLR